MLHRCPNLSTFVTKTKFSDRWTYIMVNLNISYCPLSGGIKTFLDFYFSHLLIIIYSYHGNTPPWNYHWLMVVVYHKVVDHHWLVLENRDFLVYLADPKCTAYFVKSAHEARKIYVCIYYILRCCSVSPRPVSVGLDMP